MNNYRTLAVVVVVFLSLILLLGGVFFLRSNRATDSTSTLQVLIGNYIDASAYRLEGTRLVPVPFAQEAAVLSRSRTLDEAVTVSIVRFPGQFGNVVFWESPGMNQIIDDASSIKDTVTVSSSGQYVAYSELNLPFGSTLYSENISEWNVVLRHTERGERRVLGVGYRPYILSENPLVVAYTSPQGVVVHDYTLDDQVVVLPDRVPLQTSHAAFVAPNGRHIAIFNPTTGRMSVYVLKGDFPFELSALGEVPMVVEVTALSDTALYGIVRNENTNEFTLWAYRFEDFIQPALVGTSLHVFEEGQIPYSIIP